MKKAIFKKLQPFVGSNKLISIYFYNAEPATFAVGYVIQLDQENILINLINSGGDATGFLLFKTKKIYMFSYDEQYCEKIEKLFLIKNQQRQTISNLQPDTAMSLFQYAFENHLLVEINDEPDDYTSDNHILSVTDEVLELELVNRDGNYVGKSVIDMDSVVSARCQSEYLTNLELLIDSRKK